MYNCLRNSLCKILVVCVAVFGVALVAHAGEVNCFRMGLLHSCDGYDSGHVFRPDMFGEDVKPIQCICKEDPEKVYDLTCKQIYREDGISWEWGWITSSCYYDQCENGEIRDCSTASRECTQYCDNGKWDAIRWGNCKEGYIKVGNECYETCNVSNGNGYWLED